MPTKTWVQGEEVLASDMNSLIQKQVVSTFATAAARDSAIPAPTEGMICYQADTKFLMSYRNGLWRPPIGTVLATGAAAIPNLNQNVNGVYVVQTYENGISYPFDCLVLVNSAMYGGFGGSAVSMQADIIALAGGGQVGLTPSSIIAPAASHVAVPATGVWGLAPNANTGFQLRINFQSGSNIHTGGSVSFQKVVHV